MDFKPIFMHHIWFRKLSDFAWDVELVICYEVGITLFEKFHAFCSTTPSQETFTSAAKHMVATLRTLGKENLAAMRMCMAWLAAMSRPNTLGSLLTFSSHCLSNWNSAWVLICPVVAQPASESFRPSSRVELSKEGCRATARACMLMWQ